MHAVGECPGNFVTGIYLHTGDYKIRRDFVGSVRRLLLMTGADGDEELDIRLEVGKFLNALIYCVGDSFICSVFHHVSQHQIHAYKSTTHHAH